MSRETVMRHVEVDSNGVTVSAALLGELLQVPEREVQALMAAGEIISRLERGVDEDAGRHRLIFFHGDRRARITIDDTGRILKRSVVKTGTPTDRHTDEAGASATGRHPPDNGEQP